MDGEEGDFESTPETGDHSPAEKGGPERERSMDAPFFLTALVVTVVLVAIVFFILH